MDFHHLTSCERQRTRDSLWSPCPQRPELHPASGSTRHQVKIPKGIGLLPIMQEVHSAGKTPAPSKKRTPHCSIHVHAFVFQKPCAI